MSVLTETLVDNEQFRVLRVTIEPHGQYEPGPLGHRVVIHAGSCISNWDGGDPASPRVIHRAAGDAVYQPPATPAISNLGHEAQVFVIVEAKQPVGGA